MAMTAAGSRLVIEESSSPTDQADLFGLRRSYRGSADSGESDYVIL
jgi:hypothetical protein